MFHAGVVWSDTQKPYRIATVEKALLDTLLYSHAQETPLREPARGPAQRFGVQEAALSRAAILSPLRPKDSTPFVQDRR
jgi:hypothetical protein